MSQLFRPLPCLFAPYLFVLAALTSPSSDAYAAGHKASQPEKKQERKAEASSKAAPKKAESKAASKKEEKANHSVRVAAKHHKKKNKNEELAEAKPELTGDLAVLRDTIDFVRHGKTSDATDAEKKLTDPAAQKLAEWFILRDPDSQAEFYRYEAFISDNPGWPGTGLLRRRAEARLWQEKSSAATVHAFTGDQPITARGRLALARVLKDEGDISRAKWLLREAFRSDDLTERNETDAVSAFGDILGPEDYQARMDKMIGAKEISAAMRAAHHIGDDAVSIVKACSAVKGNDDKAQDKLDSVGTDARSDLGFVLCRIQLLMRKDKIAEATHVLLAAPTNTMGLQDTDEWWRVRRILARKLLDQNDFKSAYDVVSRGARPVNENYRAEFHFMPGWIALRFLGDARTALAHFARIDEGSLNPIVLSRANYWRGRASEALGDKDATHADYQAAARYPTAYYGQLARARLGINGFELRLPQQRPDQTPPPPLADELVRATEMLYTLGERETVVCLAADLGDDSNDVPTISAVAETTGRHHDARAMLELGKSALARGLAVDAYAFPTIGIPQHTPIGPAIDRSVIYSVARTESAFNQKDKSSAQAVGLMQVTPEAGRDTAKRFGVEYDWDRLVSDPVYNTQMGAAELSALLREYAGSHIMTFAGYNAGRGRVRDWIKAHGDPRDPNVDPVDWVERIPFSETRNYVQRVMENLRVYQRRFEGDENVMAKSQARTSTVQEATALPPL
jgi:soluble lytic murein transglycosylase